ncbi:MAG: MBOAT family protein, partial [Lachnospiraceae bacterium]
DSKWINAFRVVRTFFLVNIGFVFFRADSMKSALQMLGYSVRVFNLKDLFSAAIFELGLDWIEFVIAVVSLLILLAVSILQNRGIRVREAIARRKLPVRWLIFYALLFYTILLGYYGPGYSAAEFIYQGF